MTFHCHCFHSETDQNPWLQLSLGSSYDVIEVEVHLRLSQPDLMSDFSNVHVFVGDYDFTTATTGANVFINDQNAECGVGKTDASGEKGKFKKM